MNIKFGQKLNSSDRNYIITADLHFGHKNVLKFCPDTRPWETVEDMKEGLIEHWNSQVGSDDVVFDLGDMFFCSKEETKEILDRLNGHIVR